MSWRSQTKYSSAVRARSVRQRHSRMSCVPSWRAKTAFVFPTSITRSTRHLLRPLGRTARWQLGGGRWRHFRRNIRPRRILKGWRFRRSIRSWRIDDWGLLRRGMRWHIRAAGLIRNARHVRLARHGWLVGWMIRPRWRRRLGRLIAPGEEDLTRGYFDTPLRRPEHKRAAHGDRLEPTAKFLSGQPHHRRRTEAGGTREPGIPQRSETFLHEAGLPAIERRCQPVEQHLGSERNAGPGCKADRAHCILLKIVQARHLDEVHAETDGQTHRRT